jgi:hypothetical protein
LGIIPSSPRVEGDVAQIVEDGTADDVRWH